MKTIKSILFGTLASLHKLPQIALILWVFYSTISGKPAGDGSGGGL